MGIGEPQRVGDGHDQPLGATVSGVAAQCRACKCEVPEPLNP